MDEIEAFEPWITSSDGSFVARPVTPGRVRAWCVTLRTLKGGERARFLSPGGEAEVRIVLLQGGTLVGRVLDDRGTPVVDAEVEINGARSGISRCHADGQRRHVRVCGGPRRGP